MSREVTRQLEQLGEHIERNGLHVPPVVVRVLTGLEVVPAWAYDLGAGRACYVVGGDAEVVTAIHRALLADEPLPEGVCLAIHGPTRSEFLLAVFGGPDTELAISGPRGTLKTSTALDAALLFAKLHNAAGGQLPVRVLIMGSTGVQVQAALRVIEAPWWGGVWRLEDDGRRLRCVIDGRTWVDADVVGVEDQGQGADRLRRRYHLVIGDDPAPALADVSSGFTDGAWGIAQSGLDLPTPLNRHPALLAMNAGTRTHWTTRRFITAPQPGCRLFRIPPAEGLTPEREAELARALANRPDLHARLARGEVADPLLGQPVAQGYSDTHHVAPSPLEPLRGTVWLGWDAGLTPVCLVAQVRDGELRIYAGLASERAGTRDFIENVVQPWFVQRMPWALHGGAELIHVCDPAMAAASQEDSTKAPAGTVKALLGGRVRLGPVRWPARRDPLLALFNRAVAGRPALQISPVEDCELLRRALCGMWRYGQDVAGALRPSEQPVKDHPWSDLGDSLTYVVAELFPTVDRDASRRRGTGRAKLITLHHSDDLNPSTRAVRSPSRPYTIHNL